MIPAVPGSMTLSLPTTLVAAPQECPISCGSPGFLSLCISWEAEARSLWGWQAALAFTIPPCYPGPCWGHWNNLFLCYTPLGAYVLLSTFGPPLRKVESTTPLANSESWGSDRVSAFPTANPVLIIKLLNTSLSLGGHSKHLTDS